MACGRCAVAGPTVQRTGSRSFPIASASFVTRALVVVHLSKRCPDTGILDTGILNNTLPNLAAAIAGVILVIPVAVECVVVEIAYGHFGVWAPLKARFSGFVAFVSFC